MKKIVGSILFLIVGVGVYAQQVPLTSQYMFDKYMVNDGYTGSQGKMAIHFGFRRQWVGMKEAPVTQIFSVHTPVAAGISTGLKIQNEVTGPVRRTGMGLTAAYKLKLSSEQFVSFGFTGTLNQHNLDKVQLHTYLPDDPTIAAAYTRQMVPDMNFGAYFQHKNLFYGGLSVSNLIQSRNDIYNITNDVRLQYVRNYILMGGAHVGIGSDLAIQPNLAVRMIEATPMQFDISAKALYQLKYWAGVSYRHKDAIVAMLGLNWKDLSFGYSYDITTSDVKAYTSGSHEIHLMYSIESGAKMPIDDPVF